MKKHIASMLTVMLMLSFAACENASDEISVQTDPHATESNSINITEETAQAAKPNAEEPALSLLNCSTNEDGVRQTIIPCFGNTFSAHGRAVSAFQNVPNRRALLLTTLRNRLS